jgi:hypothetical protein
MMRSVWLASLYVKYLLDHDLLANSEGTGKMISSVSVVFF